MAAIRSFEAESVFCEQMVEAAEAAAFRNRWDRDRLWLWQQREREASMRLRATRAEIGTPAPELITGTPLSEGGLEPIPAAVNQPGDIRASAISQKIPAPQTKNTAPATLFDTERSAA